MFLLRSERPQSLKTSFVAPVLVTLSIVLGWGCGPSPSSWHLKGALWEASLERERTPFVEDRLSRRFKAPERDFPLTPNRIPELGLAHGEGSVSLGAVNRGMLAKGWRLPPVGPHHRATSDQLRRGTWEATDEMVWLLLRAADALGQVRPGLKLEIANIARRGGGRIPWSVSHQSGRDADLLFPVTSNGKPYMPDTMIHLDERGSGITKDGRVVQLDVPALTAVVRGMVDQERVRIRHLFIATPLRQMVLDYALTAGVSKQLRKRMAQVLRQPRGALPHNDHLHVRIMCSEEDILEGCSDMGGQARQKRLREPLVQELLSSLNRQIGKQKATTLRRLGRLAPNDARVKAAFLRGLSSKSASVRRVALRSLKGSAGAELDRALSKWLARDQKAEEVALLIDVVERRTDRLWTRTIRALISNPPQAIPGPIVALRTTVGEGIWLAGVTADPRLLELVFRMKEKPLFRVEAEKALSRILIPPPTEASPEQVDMIWEVFSGKSREEREMMRLDHLRTWGLVDAEGRVDKNACYQALKGQDDASFHAARRLLDIGHPKACRCPRWSPSDLRHYWRRRL